MKQPATIDGYIRAAPEAGQPHLRKVYAILRAAAPDAEEAIKWGAPFFIEPRFLFSFSGHKAHLNFAPSPETLEAFGEELEGRRTTKNYLQVPYGEPVPEDLIRRIAEYRVKMVAEREDDAFW